jgi:Na+-driven multidrug efflux pump
MAIPDGSNASDSRVRGALRGVHRALSALSPVDRAFIQFKASLGILLMVPLVQLPSVRDNTTVFFLVLWCAVTILGFWISLTGLIMGAQNRRRGFRVEMFGLWLLFAGPAVFASLMAGLWIITGQQRAVAVMFAVVICLAVRARMVMIRMADKNRAALYHYMEDGPDEA